MQKHKPIRSKAIRNSARGEQCTLQIAGICNVDPATTVLAHLPDESHGMGQKGSDLNAVYACSRCHDAIDRRSNWHPEGESMEGAAAIREWYMRRAMVRTWKRLVEKGIMEVKG